MLTMSHPDELEISRLQESLRAIEREFASGMRARGFDPAQDENLALTSSLAKLYEERNDLRARLAVLFSNDEQKISED
ncbi:MAG: hypothetical protein AABN95_18245 [Acidobacteriota bacterium]